MKHVEMFAASDESVTQDNRHITPGGHPFRGIFSEVRHLPIEIAITCWTAVVKI